ncbi:hypothetical protein [Zavarzinella formosa]|uniref:hypothetical protein n=1 Tax=Zavarzinella formosa TaxID=360055 RepID=UPI0003186ACB|nr:hypothetical protein [Zavarzinella formosa]
MRVFPLILIVLAGCQAKPTENPAVPSPETAPAPTVPARLAFDETKGHLDRPSGVGFVYPRGWDNLGVTDQSGVVSLSMRRREPPVEVSIQWSKLEENLDDKSVGDGEFNSLQSLYGDKAGKPEPCKSGDQSGFRLSFAGGPRGATGVELKGLVYVFAVRHEQQWWKVRLRATSRDDSLTRAAEGLLKNFRW